MTDHNLAARTDWKEVEARVNQKGNEVSQHRTKQPVPEAILGSLKDLGVAIPPESKREITAPTEPEKQLLRLQVADVRDALRENARHNNDTHKLSKHMREIGSKQDLPEGTRVKTIQAIADRISESAKELGETMMSSPESFLAIASSQMRRLRKQLAGGRIAETSYVTNKIDSICEMLSRGRVIFMHGETGTGKTEVAKIAGRRFSNQEPIVVRGFSGMNSEELFGHMTLTSSAVEKLENRIASISDRLDEQKTINPQTTEAEKAQLITNLLSQNGVTVSEYILGSVYIAAKEGRTLIIDEANYIPPPLLAKMNDIMTKRPGESINVQEDGVGPVTVKEGFGIIMTGNINPDPKDKRYQGRHTFDLAALDRMKVVEYNYLPQAIEGKPGDHPAEQKQLFQIAVASLLAPYRTPTSIPLEVKALESIENRHGSMYLPGGEAGLDALWRLCQLASVTQGAFAGQIKDNDPNSYQINGVSTGYRPDIALSPRVLMGILEEWKADGFRYQLDRYLKEALIDRAISPNDRGYLNQLAQKFGFFKQDGEKSVAPEFIPGRKVIEALYTEIPQRTVWPDGVRGADEISKANAAQLVALRAKFQATEEEAKGALERYAGFLDTTAKGQTEGA